MSEMSTFRNLKIDEDSIEIKRQLDPEALQQAALIRDEVIKIKFKFHLNFKKIKKNSQFISAAQDEYTGITEQNQKFITSTEKFKKHSTTALPKFSIKRKDSQKITHETEIDIENLPVIQGSFEITKTDADITQKRKIVRPTPTVSTLSSTTKHQNLSPTIRSNHPNIVNTNRTNDEILEKFWQHQKKINELKTSNITENIGILNVTSVKPDVQKQELKQQPKSPISNKKIDKEFPKLDTNLFTTAPVIDNEPWFPINPGSTHSTTEANYDNPPTSKPVENVMYRNKASDSFMSLHNSTGENDPVLYQSFYNTDFSGSSLEVEKLGVADVKPYPLPVNKIDFSEESDVKKNQPIDTGEFETTYDKERFEHLGGGVIAKKTESNETHSISILDNYSDFQETTEIVNFTEIDYNSTIDTEQSVTQNSSPSTEKLGLNFLNMKDFIVHKMQKNITTSKHDDKSFNTTILPIDNDANSEQQLFPSITKWEFVNGTRLNNDLNITKKVFNETLQAFVVVENFKTSSSNSRTEDEPSNQTTNKANIQQLSSIFDTLASKLGLNPDITSKIPPFSQQSQNKLKQNNNRIKLVPGNNTINSKLTSTTTSKTTDIMKVSLMGQAEVEAVDPTKYDEILSYGSSPLMHSSTVPSLVTLMPVKSNSAIRLFKPPFKKTYDNNSKNLETVVKTSVLFDT